MRPALYFFKLYDLGQILLTKIASQWRVINIKNNIFRWFWCSCFGKRAVVPPCVWASSITLIASPIKYYFQFGLQKFFNGKTSFKTSYKTVACPIHFLIKRFKRYMSCTTNKHYIKQNNIKKWCLYQKKNNIKKLCRM